LAITGFDKAFAASPASPPVSGPGQNPGQNGQNPGQNGQNQVQNQLNGEVSGSFSGTHELNFGCSLFTETYDATYTTNTGTGSISIDGCVTPESQTLFSFSGSFTLTAPDGATLQGTAAGSETSNNASNASVSFTLTPTSGTNEFASVTGVINLIGTWQSGAPGLFSGSLSGALT